MPPYGVAQTERYRIEPVPTFPSRWNNSPLLTPGNFAGQDGDRSYPIHYTYDRHITDGLRMYDTRDFVNHHLDSRSNDYTPRFVPVPAATGNFKPAAGFTPVNPNGTVNAFNPPTMLHGLPPVLKTSDYFIQAI